MGSTVWGGVMADMLGRGEGYRTVGVWARMTGGVTPGATVAGGDQGWDDPCNAARWLPDDPAVCDAILNARLASYRNGIINEGV